MALTKHILISNELEKYLLFKRKFEKECYNSVLERLLKLKSTEGKNE